MSKYKNSRLKLGLMFLWLEKKAVILWNNKTKTYSSMKYIQILSHSRFICGICRTDDLEWCYIQIIFFQLKAVP